MRIPNQPADAFAMELAIGNRPAHEATLSPDEVGARALLTCMTVEGLLACVAVITAIFVGRKPDAFFAEGSFITIASSLQLLLISGLCLLIYQIRSDHARTWLRGSHVLWALGAIGMAALVFDEAVGLHESADRQIHQAFALRESPWTDRIDDVIILGYGLAAGAAAWVCRRELVQLRGVARFFIFSSALFLAMVAADLLTNSYSTDQTMLSKHENLQLLASWANALEDTIKLCTEGSLVAALIATFWMFRRGSSGRSVATHRL
jgi:hypothetical protein